jgi:hypothetical protein
MEDLHARAQISRRQLPKVLATINAKETEPLKGRTGVAQVWRRRK